MSIIKLFLFCISTLGSFEWIRIISKDKVNIYFLPSLTIAVQITFLFLAGVLNLLPEGVIILYIAGFAGIIISIYKNKNLSFIKDYLNVGYTVLFLIMCIILIYVKGKIFTGYDNFSHWALVVKRMLEVDRYPNFQDTLITFQEYPLGSSSYIYFFAKLISTSESVQMLAQTYMIGASLLPLFAFAKKNKASISIVLISFINFILVYNICVTDLLVDTLLPIVGASGVLFAFVHCKKDCEKMELCLSSFYMIELVQIKNSGIFFTILIALLILKYMRMNKQYVYSCLSVAAPFISLMLWQKHCNYVFVAAATSKHTMTIDNYRAVFGDKTMEDIHTICISMLKYVIMWKDVWVAIIISGALGVLIWFFKRNLGKEFRKLILFSIGVYVIYQMGMLAMYLFSMPIDEALVLASIERYIKTILMFILYFDMALITKMLSEIYINKGQTIIVTSVAFISFFVYSYISSGQIKFVTQDVPDASERNWIEAVKKEYRIPNEESYCVVIPENDAGYARYLTKYIFQSSATSSVIAEDQKNLDDISAKYIFIYDKENTIMNEWIRKNYPDQYGNEVIIQGE